MQMAGFGCALTCNDTGRNYACKVLYISSSIGVRDDRDVPPP